MIWNWDNIQHRAEYPDPLTLIFGHPVVYEDGRELDLKRSYMVQISFDSEARVRELGR